MVVGLLDLVEHHDRAVGVGQVAALVVCDEVVGPGAVGPGRGPSGSKKAAGLMKAQSTGVSVVRSRFRAVTAFDAVGLANSGKSGWSMSS